MDQAAQVQKVMFGQWAAALRAEGAYPVVERGEDGKPVGVITRHDLLGFLSDGFAQS